MLIQVGGKGFGPNAKLQAEIKKKIELSLARFRARIVRVSAFLEDVNGPKHGVDKSVRIVVNLERQPSVIIVDKGETWRSAIDNAIERATSTVSRQIDRLRSKGDRTVRIEETEHYLENRFGQFETN